MKQTKAFTLIELSIVVVIIGLIVAGVVAGQSLVRQAHLRGLISDLNKYEAAIISFKLQYNAIPGDIANAYSYWGASCGANSVGAVGSCNGDGDKRIDWVHAVTQNPPQEDLMAWRHLSLAGLISGSFTGQHIDNSARYRANVNSPKSSMGPNVIFGLTHLAGGGNVVFGRQNGNAILVGDTANQNTGSTAWEQYPIGGILNRAEGASMDGKMDDGLAGAGRLVGTTFIDGTGSGCTNVLWFNAPPPIAQYTGTGTCFMVFYFDNN